MPARRPDHPQRHLPGAVPPKICGPAQGPRPTAPIPPVKWASSAFAVQRQASALIQRADQYAAYRPPPLPTLWDWIEEPLRQAEARRASAPPPPPPLPAVRPPDPGPLPQQLPPVVRDTGIGELLKQGVSAELSTALKAKYGDELGGEMSRQMRIKSTTDEQVLKRRAEEKIGRRQESEFSSPAIGSGRLNVKEQQVANIQHGTGGGFRVGVPGLWHVHFDHVKWGTSKATRINFTNRPRAAILADFLAHQPPQGSLHRPSWDTCYHWMQTNLP